MAAVLRAERVWVETFTGLRMDQFGRLLKAVRERGGEGCGWGRPWRLPLAERVLLVAVYYRTNLTMRQLAPLFGVSPATVCRVIQRLVADGFTDLCTRSNQGNYPTRIAGIKPKARTAALRIAAQILFSGDPWSAARAIVDFAARPLPVRALPLNEAWRKRPPQDTTRLLARIVESVRVAVPFVKGHDGRVLR